MYDRPFAAPGLTSYRYPLLHGFIMIGASSDDDAMSEAKRSLSARHQPQRDRLEKWNGERYERLAPAAVALPDPVSA